GGTRPPRRCFRSGRESLACGCARQAGGQMSEQGRDPMTDSHDCLFCRIVRGEIPARKVYEDDEILAFHDIHPAAALHLLLIPKVHVENLYSAEASHEALLG